MTHTKPDWRCFRKGGTIYCSQAAFEELGKRIPLQALGPDGGMFFDGTPIVIRTSEQLDHMERNCLTITSIC
jgi:hypothetical protein